jgi:hypothetical protein
MSFSVMARYKVGSTVIVGSDSSLGMCVYPLFFLRWIVLSNAMTAIGPSQSRGLNSVSQTCLLSEVNPN